MGVFQQQSGRRARAMFLALALVLFPGSISPAQNTKRGVGAMSAQRTVLPADNFKTLSKTSQVPADVKEAFEKETGEPFFMAEPNGKFDSGCVRTPGNPSMRLKLGGLSQDHCFLFYESGGFAHSFNVALFSVGAGKADLIWKTYLHPAAAMKVTTVESLRQALESQSVH